MAKYKEDTTEENSVCEIVRENETNFNSGTTTISRYVSFSLSENLDKIDAYLNSKHTSGDKDSLDRDKPFFNIVTSAVNIWFRATDLDRKDIRIKASKSSYKVKNGNETIRVPGTVLSLLANIHLNNFMKKSKFGVFLNDWGISLARYGSSVVKFIENDDGLNAMVIPWNRLIVDPIDFDNDVVIEVLELTPSQLRKRKGYDQELVDKLIDATTTRETTRGEKKDTKANFIKLYEVHGELPLSYLTGKEKDEETYVQQMHVVSFVASKEKGKFDDYCLIKGREKKNPYMITHLIKEDGRTQSIGAVEHLFEAQWMQNHTVKAIKDQLDLASKLIFQTADGNFVGQNAINAIETGDILTHAVNMPLTQLQNNSHDITSLQSFGSQWKALGNEITGISEAMLGAAPKAGTAWRQTEAILQESHSLFEIMTENKGLSSEDMLREYIIPFIKNKMNSTEEISASLGDYNVSQIEDMYVKTEAIKRNNNVVIETILNGEIAQGLDLQAEEQNIRNELQTNGNQRFFAPSELKSVTWKDVFEDFEWECDVEITGESSNKAEMATTINSILNFLARKQGQPLTPDERLVFNKMLDLTGTVSPLELSEVQNKPVAPIGGAGVETGQLPVIQ